MGGALEMSGATQQSGPVSRGRIAVWAKNGVVMDGGPAGNGLISEVGITNDGSLAIGVNSGPTALPFVQLGFTVNSDGVIVISANSFGGGPAAELLFEINGSTYAFNPAGGGNITGPTTSVSGDLLAFNGTGGNLVEDTGIEASAVAALLAENIVIGPGTVVAGDLAIFSGTHGNLLADSGLLTTNIVQGPTIAVAGDLASFDDTTGKLIEDSNVKASAVATGLTQIFPPIASIAALEAATETTLTQNQCYVLGYYASGDGGEDAFYLGANATPNGGTIINDASGRSWYREIGGLQWSVRKFGAKLDGATDDTTAWQNILLASRLAGNPAIFHPGGNSIFIGNLVLQNDAIIGVGSFYAGASGLTQDSMITFHGNNAGITLLDSTSGGITLEKIGFKGLPGTYSGQVGLLLPDSLRTGLGEGWPMLRDVSFGAFSTGISVGEKYQTGWMWNVYCYDSVEIGYENDSTDWYHHGISCGSSTVIASFAQLVLGPASPSSFSSGSHQFIGGAFFGADFTVVIRNSFGSSIRGAAIQNAQSSGVIIGDGTNGCGNNTIDGCTFSGNNAAGGTRNAGNATGADITMNAGVRQNIITGNFFAQNGAGNTAVGFGIALAGFDTGNQISNNHFNMDNIVTPTMPSAPVAITVPASLALSGGDQIMVTDNMASYGENGIYPVQFQPVNMTSLFSAVSVTGTTLSLQAGSAYLGGSVSTVLPDPVIVGRTMTISGASGNSFTTATVNGLNNTNRTCTFGSASWISLLADGPLGWVITGSNAVTLS